VHTFHILMNIPTKAPAKVKSENYYENDIHNGEVDKFHQ